MKLEKVNGYYIPASNQKPLLENVNTEKFFMWCDAQNKNFKTVIDIGAGCGVISKKFAPRSKKIYAFESNKIYFNCLEKNTFNISQIVEPNNFLIGITSTVDKVETRTLDSFNFLNTDVILINGKNKIEILESAQKLMKSCRYVLVKNDSDVSSYLKNINYRLILEDVDTGVFCCV